MPRVITVTPNPALDIFAATDQVRPTSKMRCSGVLRTAGGGGVNVARVLHALGVSATALFPQGGTTGALLQSLLSEQGVHFRAVQVAGLTRESFTVQDLSDSQEYRFVLPGPTLNNLEVAALLQCVQDALQSGSGQDDHRPQWLVVSGSLPPGVSLDFYGSMAELARESGVQLVVDAGAASLRAALEHGVFLAKPSLGELRLLTGHALTTLQEVADAASALVGQGAVQVLLVSLGGQGALLVTQHGVRFVGPMDVPVRSALGAGDSLVAGMLAGLSAGLFKDDACRFAVACASVSLGLEPGQAMPPALVRQHYERVHFQSQLPTRMQLN